MQVLVLPHSTSGSSPTGMLAQVPFWPPVFCALHALQVPLQASLQHTWSTQLPLAHSLPATQAAPSGDPPPPHIPIPLQVPFTPHAVPCGAGGFEGSPLVHMSRVHSRPSMGRSVLSSCGGSALPIPLQTTIWQSPSV